MADRHAPELLPCPFCGKHSTVILKEYDSRWFGVSCDVCDSNWSDTTREGVIERWNRRPLEDGLRAEVTQLKRQLAEKHKPDQHTAAPEPWTNKRIYDIATELAKDHRLSVAMTVNVEGLMKQVRDDMQATIDQLRAELATLREATGWEPVDHVQLASGREVHSDNIGLSVGRDDKLHNMVIWPDDGYEYAVCRRVVGQEGE